MIADSAHPAARFSFIVAALALAIAVAPPAGAQVLRGTVRDSASRQPVAGAVIILLDSADRAIGRNITNDQGRYSIALSPLIYRVRIVRIGFRPRVFRLPASDPALDNAVPLDVAMAAIPTLLEAVTIVDQPNCPRRDDGPAAFALWEQTKTALLATVVAGEANPPTLVRLHFKRRLDRDDHITSQTVEIDSASTSRPFAASRRAAEFVDRGFAHDSAGSQWFDGPDAGVMLDDAFARGYCFHLADSDGARPNEIGLAFASATRRRGRIDIEGAVWIDSVTRRLTDIVFRYIGLDSRVDRLRPGGRISFRTMDNGMVIIDRWFLRFAGAAPIANGRIRVRQLATLALEAQESGGEVAHARWNDGRQWQASLGLLLGRIPENGAGAVVQLLGTDYGATADSTGAFAISNLIPGPYTVGAADPRFANLGVLLKTVGGFVAERDSTVLLSIDIPSVEEYVAAKCRASPRTLGEASLVLRVVMPNGEPADAAGIEIRLAREGSLQRIAAETTDKNGLAYFCHAPRSAELQIRAEHDGAAPALVVREIDSEFVTLKLQLHPQKR